MKTDIFGFDLKIGDEVAFNPPYYKGLRTGKIVKFTPKGVVVAWREKGMKVDRHTTVFQVAKKQIYEPHPMAIALAQHARDCFKRAGMISTKEFER